MDETTSFGAWLSRRRKSLDQTQAELARQLGCATVTLQKIELDERRPSKEMAERLAEVLEIAPEERAAFLKSARGELAVDHLATPVTAGAIPAPWHARPRPAHNLPAQSTPLIGREREVAALSLLFQDPAVRLVTLTGPGGAGKTSLALQVAAVLLDDFGQGVPDGVWLVELAPLGDPALIPAAIAQALGVKESGGRLVVESLKAALREKRLVLLLDNFEHMLAAAPLVSELLAAAPHIKVLATSQSLLRLYGEHQFPALPLEHPDLEHLPALDALGAYAAVELFIQRARAVKPDFALTSANAAAVAGICARLDGVPLALELAAARVRIFPPQALLARLHPDSSRQLATLTGGARDRPARQQSLRSTIDWSYHLLDPAEQKLFARLAVFAGGCSMEAAEAVCGDPDDALSAGGAGDEVADGLVSLVDKSLARQQEGADGEPRFTMLESIREYALERLAASGEAAALGERHARYYMAWLERLVPVVREHRSVPADRIQPEIGNLAATVQWIIDTGNVDLALRWHDALWWFGSLIKKLAGWQAWNRWRHALLDSRETTQERAMALIRVGRLAWHEGALAQAAALLEEALALARTLDAPLMLLEALGARGDVFRDQELYAQAAQLYEEFLALAQALGEQDYIAAGHHFMGELALLREDYPLALKMEQVSLALYLPLGVDWGIAGTLMNAGFAALHLGDDDLAAHSFDEGFSIARSNQIVKYMVVCLIGFAALAARQRRSERAVRLLGATETLQDIDGLVHVHRREYERLTTTVRSGLDPITWNAAWAEGKAMTLEQAVAYALADDDKA